MSSYDDDLYGTLGVAADATAQSIRDAYNKKAQRFHPDAGGDPYSWKTIQRAYDTLIDADRRAEYDAYWAEDDNDGSSSDDEDNPWTQDLASFDLFDSLGVVRSGIDGDGVSGGEARVLSDFTTR